jgi:hypothetical protein
VVEVMEVLEVNGVLGQLAIEWMKVDILFNNNYLRGTQLFV